MYAIESVKARRQFGARRRLFRIFLKVQSPVVVKTHSPFSQPFGGENYLTRVVAEMLYDVKDRIEDRGLVSLRLAHPLQRRVRIRDSALGFDAAQNRVRLIECRLQQIDQFALAD